MRNFLLLSILFISVSGYAQSGKDRFATVYFMRSTGVAGMGAFHVFMDEGIICRLNNNSYSVHQVQPGLHKMQVRGSGQKPNKKLNTLDIDMVAGETYYISVDAINESMVSYILLMEVTVNTANMKLKTLDEDKKCN